MEMGREQHEESSGGSPQGSRHVDASGRHARFTVEQVEVLGKVYSECPTPGYAKREELIREFPVLANVDQKQIKIWFQNRRCRDKQRKEATELLTANRKLKAINEVLRGENDRLQQQVQLLLCENSCMRQKLDRVTADNGGSCGSVITTPQPPLRDTNKSDGLLLIAEETLRMFLSKAIGTAVNWVQIPGMKPGPDTVGIFSIRGGGSEIAARACGLVNLDATKIAEILKDRACWFQDCREIEVITTTPTDNGGIVELVYTQIYAPATLAQARDYWTLRYTTTLENGSLVVCERSLSGSGVGPDSDTVSQFVRGEMLPSGYLIKPCEGGGSIIHIVDHINLEAENVPEVLQPLYNSSEVVAQRMTIPALRYVRQIAQEATGDVEYEQGKEPAVLRTYSQKLSRGFNDAINGFSDDGWSQFSCGADEDVMITVKSTNPTTSSSSNQSLGGVLCAKASVLLKVTNQQPGPTYEDHICNSNVPPAELIRFLREHRSEWADFSVESYCAGALKFSCYPTPDRINARFSSNRFIMPLGHTIEHEQTLEVIRLVSLSDRQKDPSFLGGVNFLQMCSGTDETSIGAYSELVFSPINDIMPDNYPLLPSGIRIIPLNVKSGSSSGHGVNQSTTSNGAKNQFSSYAETAILTIAFQFPIGNSLPEHLASVAREYVRRVISSVYRVSEAVTPLQLRLDHLSNLYTGSQDAQTLALWIWQDYSSHVGGELPLDDWLDGDVLLQKLWYHQNAILCCSLKEPQPQFVFANQAGLNMLETTLMALQDITLDTVMSYSALKKLNTEFPRIMHRGFSYLPDGSCTSTMGRHCSYDEAVAWKVAARDVVADHCLVIAFVNWSFA